ncbi:MAG: hypothetical protein HQL50_12160 [Magnetococcales bacterium]|nr:hypothetical protein [Magnetococcales bacterium]
MGKKSQENKLIKQALKIADTELNDGKRSRPTKPPKVRKPKRTKKKSSKSFFKKIVGEIEDIFD